MRIYLSAPFSHGKSLRWLRDALRERGYTVDCRWLDAHLEVGPEPTPEQRAAFAAEDLADVRDSDVVVTFTMPEHVDTKLKSGGRHVEVGAALAWGIPVIAIGPKENVFYWHDRVTQVDHDGGSHDSGWMYELLDALRGRELAIA